MQPKPLEHEELLKRLAYFGVGVVRRSKDHDIVLGRPISDPKEITTIDDKSLGKKLHSIKVIHSVLRHFNIDKKDFWQDLKILKRKTRPVVEA